MPEDAGTRREPLLHPEGRRFGRLLRVEIVRVPGSVAQRCRAAVLTFDVERFVIEAGDGELRLTPAPDDDALPGALEDAREEEPWWKLLGSRLPRAWAVIDPAGRRVGLDLQLREDGDRPRIVSLALDGASLRVSERSRPEWERRIGWERA